MYTHLFSQGYVGNLHATPLTGKSAGFASYKVEYQIKKKTNRTVF